MSARRVKLYEKQPGDTYGHDAKVYYGQRFSGAIFDHVEIIDHPQSISDLEWIEEHLKTRIAPGGTITHEGESWHE